MPTLYVIAGPNGAGKSTLSVALLPEAVPSFDGDKQLQDLKDTFPDTDEAQLFTHVVDVVFPAAKESAIQDGRDFAYETNFSTDEVMQTVQAFKDKGYFTELIYIGLPTVEQAMTRVQLRIDQGGHRVNREDVLYNYQAGLKNTATYIARFDRAVILENAVTNSVSLPRILAKYQRGKLIEQAKDLPAWTKKITERKGSLFKKNREGRSKGRRRES